MGRRSKYDEETTPVLAEQYARDGLNNQEIAAKLGIAGRTLYEWQNKYPQFDQALKEGKEVVDAKVEKKFLKRALGYSYTETEETTNSKGELTRRKVTKKHLPPDVGALKSWLTNRRPDKWRKEPKETPVNIDSEEYFEALNKQADKLWGDD